MKAKLLIWNGSFSDREKNLAGGPTHGNTADCKTLEFPEPVNIEIVSLHVKDVLNYDIIEVAVRHEDDLDDINGLFQQLKDLCRNQRIAVTCISLKDGGAWISH